MTKLVLRSLILDIKLIHECGIGVWYHLFHCWDTVPNTHNMEERLTLAYGSGGSVQLPSSKAGTSWRKGARHRKAFYLMAARKQSREAAPEGKGLGTRHRPPRSRLHVPPKYTHDCVPLISLVGPTLITLTLYPDRQSPHPFPYWLGDLQKV